MNNSIPDISTDLARVQASLKSGGGGGTFDPMEARVKHLEDDMKDVKTSLRAIDDRLRGVETRVAEISGKISNLPGWPGLLTIAGVIIAAVGLMIRFMPPAG